MKFVCELAIVGGGAVETAAGRVVDDTLWGESVDANLAVGVNDVAIAKVDANMSNAPLTVTEKAKIIAVCLLKRGDKVPLAGLLGGIA